MRSLIIGMAVLILAEATPAAVQPVPDKHFSARIRMEYSTSAYQVFQKGGQWICRTRSSPFIEARSNPLAGLDWKRLQSARRVPGCRDFVALEDFRSSPPRKAQGCLSSPAFRDFMESLSKACTP